MNGDTDVGRWQVEIDLRLISLWTALPTPEADLHVDDAVLAAAVRVAYVRGYLHGRAEADRPPFWEPREPSETDPS